MRVRNMQVNHLYRSDCCNAHMYKDGVVYKHYIISNLIRGIFNKPKRDKEIWLYYQCASCCWQYAQEILGKNSQLIPVRMSEYKHMKVIAKYSK